MADRAVTLKDLLLDTRDGDWGEDVLKPGYAPYRVIRGTDFPHVRFGDLSSVPMRYISAVSASRRALKAGDILIETAGGSRDRPTGRVAFITDRLVSGSDLPLTCASFCRYLRVDGLIADPAYVYWYLQYLYSLGEMWQHQVQHTGIARFQYTNFAAITPIPLPPIDEQRAIASILGALDDKIELNGRMNATLEALARALFTSWFVDFDPVRARAEGRQPAAMDAATAALFPDGFEESAIGPIPRGWRLSPIGDEVRVVGGSTPRTDEPGYWNDGNIHWATPKDLAQLDAQALIDTERRITEAGLVQISSGLLPAGTVLMSSRAPVGYLAISEIPVAINQGFIAMVCERALPNVYALHWARANMDIITARANGTTFLEISKASFRPINVLVPPSHVLSTFATQAGEWHRLVVNNLHQSRTLAAMRDTLLPKLLSGAVRVREAERVVGAAI